MKQPQEIEYWYLLPAIRKEIAKVMLDDHNLNQKEIAKILHITEAAVSQYLKGKRASEVQLDMKAKKMIKLIAKEAVNKTPIIKKINEVLDYLRKNQCLCRTHRKYDRNVPKICKICFG